VGGHPQRGDRRKIRVKARIEPIGEQPLDVVPGEIPRRK
jgi:hypothetical protein